MYQEEKNKPTDPIIEKEEVQESNDPKIDQDVPGFPHPPSTKEDLEKTKEDVDDYDA